jgi:lipopolysaccharide export system protein LptA
VRFTIERIRMLVVAAAVLLLAALGIFLVAAKWKNRTNRRDLPQRLAKEIQQEANGFSFVHAYGARSQYKIHASKEVQLRDNRVLLHEVRIELYGEDGSLVDQIAGDTFEYDQKSGLAIAVGPVEMVLTQPANAVAKSQTAGQKTGNVSAPLRQIHVKTSGVTFDQDTGVVSTMQRVDFSMTQGSGSSMGATYDSQKGDLTLEQAVELITQRGTDPVKIRAQHAEFDRGAQTCWMRSATADYRGAQAGAAQAKILFREDGSAEELDATDGFTLATTTGGHIAAPTATMDFDEHSQPRHGHLEGGVSMDSMKEGRTVHGTSPTAELDFVGQGQLRHAHLERGVAFASHATSAGSSDETGSPSFTRTWRSPVADVDFRDAGRGQVEPASLHGMGGVVVTSESQHGSAAIVPAKMVADDVTGTFGPNSTLRSMTGIGHAGIEQTTATGTRQTASGDRLEASFTPSDVAQNRDQEGGEQGSEGASHPSEQKSLAGGPGREQGPKGLRDPSTSLRTGSGTERPGSGTGVQSAELTGHVTLFQQAATKPGGQAQPPLRATAGKAVYEGEGDWLHLTLSPRVQNGGLEMTADKVDVSQQSGDAFAHGNVKATWSGGAPGATPGRQTAAAGNNASQGAMAIGGNGPAHVVASDAHLNESTGEATFRGHARLWQQANSIAGPEIVLNQHMQTLVAKTNDPEEPVRAVLLSAGGAPGMSAGTSPDQNGDGAATGKSATPSVIRVHGGDLWYSDAEHRGVMHSGVLSAVVAETATATSSSDQLELRLMPAGPNGGQAQVDRMIASGHVVLSSQGRRGVGEQLVYSSVTGDYVLTGTNSTPPHMSDPDRGNVTGEALIFHSRDDSVSIEGGGRETITRTTAPEAHGKP